MTHHPVSMFAEVQSPESLSGVELDAFLERGWFRMGQTVFTTNFLNFKNDFYSALWLRIDLTAYQPDRTELKLLKQNAHLRVVIQPLKLDDQKELLYAVYKNGVSFEASATLHQLMYRDSAHNIFTTMEVNVFDDDRLVACGFFDLGRNTAAGITSFYDPNYKKYSLGKFLIYTKISYCRERGLKYFYPGYFVPGYSPFDYKLSIGKNELYFLDYKLQQWRHIHDFDVHATPLAVMLSKLQSLQDAFRDWSIEVRLLKYDFFDANLLPGLQGIHLFDIPVFVYPLDVEEEVTQPVIIYDLRDDKFHLLKCASVWKSNYPRTADTYSSHLLKTEMALFSTDDPEEMVAVFVSALSSKTTDIFPDIQTKGDH